MQAGWYLNVARLPGSACTGSRGLFQSLPRERLTAGAQRSGHSLSARQHVRSKAFVPPVTLAMSSTGGDVAPAGAARDVVARRHSTPGACVSTKPAQKEQAPAKKAKKAKKPPKQHERIVALNIQGLLGTGPAQRVLLPVPPGSGRRKSKEVEVQEAADAAELIAKEDAAAAEKAALAGSGEHLGVAADVDSGREQSPCRRASLSRACPGYRHGSPHCRSPFNPRRFAGRSSMRLLAQTMRQSS